MEAVVSPCAGREQTFPYCAYGLGLRSFLRLPATRGYGGIADVEVRRASLSTVAADLSIRGCANRVTGGEIHLRLPGVGTFLVRDGREILVDPDPAAGERMLAHAVAGPLMAALLQQRGLLVLHASAVEIGGEAVAFLGSCGAGKSTIAAALHRAGHGFIADDVVVVRMNGSTPRVAPGVPQLKLWPDAMRAIGGNPDRHARIDPQFTKRACAVTERFRARTTVPLACLFLLRRSERLDVEPLAPGKAFLEIVAHAFGAHWLHGVGAQEMFRARSELVRRVPVRRLLHPTSLDGLPEVVRRVEESRGCR